MDCRDIGQLVELGQLVGLGSAWARLELGLGLGLGLGNQDWSAARLGSRHYR